MKAAYAIVLLHNIGDRALNIFPSVHTLQRPLYDLIGFKLSFAHENRNQVLQSVNLKH